MKYTGGLLSQIGYPYSLQMHLNVTREAGLVIKQKMCQRCLGWNQEASLPDVLGSDRMPVNAAGVLWDSASAWGCCSWSKHKDDSCALYSNTNSFSAAASPLKLVELCGTDGLTGKYLE